MRTTLAAAQLQHRRFSNRTLPHRKRKRWLYVVLRKLQHQTTRSIFSIRRYCNTTTPCIIRVLQLNRPMYLQKLRHCYASTYCKVTQYKLKKPCKTKLCKVFLLTDVTHNSILVCLFKTMFSQNTQWCVWSYLALSLRGLMFVLPSFLFYRTRT